MIPFDYQDIKCTQDMTDMTGKSSSYQIEVMRMYNKQEGWERTSLNNPSPYIISHSWVSGNVSDTVSYNCI